MTEEQKESQYLLQRIDCNCNNCGFMKRDMDRFKKWYDYWYAEACKKFEDDKKKAIEDADLIEDPKQRASLIQKAQKLKFYFRKDNLLQYGHCMKFDKSVSFIPDTCQIDTQFCFIHRRDYIDPAI
jgi:hypothetical protein